MENGLAHRGDVKFEAMVMLQLKSRQDIEIYPIDKSVFLVVGMEEWVLMSLITVHNASFWTNWEMAVRSAYRMDGSDMHAASYRMDPKLSKFFPSEVDLGETVRINIGNIPGEWHVKELQASLGDLVINHPDLQQFGDGNGGEFTILEQEGSMRNGIKGASWYQVNCSPPLHDALINTFQGGARIAWGLKRRTILTFSPPKTTTPGNTTIFAITDNDVPTFLSKVAQQPEQEP
jgi:hypothetical protein